MVAIANRFTVFTKPWPQLSLYQLGKLVKDMGFDGVELPVRTGYQVTPDHIARDLPEAVKILGDCGVVIGSVAGSSDERTIAAMGEAGIKILRLCVNIDIDYGYMATVKRVRSEYDALVPILDKYGVTLGVQNHCDYCVGSAIGIMHLIENYLPKHIGAVLDPAHCAVDGEPEIMALDIVWSHLCLINFKSAFHMRTNGPEASEAEWAVHWTTARHSGYSWRALANCLRGKMYAGDICLPAEYSGGISGGMVMGDDVVPLVTGDLKYLKVLLSGTGDSAATAVSTDWQSTGKR